MPSPTAPAAATGLPSPDFASQIFPRAKLAAMSMHDLAQLSQLLWVVQGAITQSAIINHPGPITPACDMLQDFSGEVVSALSDIAATARAHQPTDAGEARWRAWLLLSSAALFSSDLAEIAVTATNAVADERSFAGSRH
ncbi:hypothetical protein ACQKLX_07165 [Bosea sp. NPDC003192]|uniref:hypothetical protein n=1 Tax=Bosea sp. NPDC003192 TaxID=3390551 RepID=UPI003D08A842